MPAYLLANSKIEPWWVGASPRNRERIGLDIAVLVIMKPFLRNGSLSGLKPAHENRYEPIRDEKLAALGVSPARFCFFRRDAPALQQSTGRAIEYAGYFPKEKAITKLKFQF